MTADSYAQKVETVARALLKARTQRSFEMVNGERIPSTTDAAYEDARAALAALATLASHPEAADAGALCRYCPVTTPAPNARPPCDTCPCKPGNVVATAPAPAISGGENDLLVQCRCKAGICANEMYPQYADNVRRAGKFCRVERLAAKGGDHDR